MSQKFISLKVIILVSDGSSDDNFDQETMVLNEHLHIKMAAIVTKRFYKDRLKPVTRYEEAIFTVSTKINYRNIKSLNFS